MALPEIIKDIEARIIRPTSTDNAIVRFDGTTGQVQNSTPLIDDNGNIVLPTNTGSIRKSYSAANTTPILNIAAIDQDVSIFRASWSSSFAETSNWGYTLKYRGTGSGLNNFLTLYADNLSASSQVIGLSINQSGYLGVGADPKSTHRLYINGKTYCEDSITLQTSSAAYDPVGLIFGATAARIGADNGNSLGLYANDNIYFRTGCDFTNSSYPNGILMTPTAFYPLTTGVALGTSSNKWANVYSTVFTGNLTGTATNATNVTVTAGSGNIERPLVVNSSLSGQNLWHVEGVTANYQNKTITAPGGFIGNASSATKDGNGNVIASTYLPLTGGTLTGNLAILTGNTDKFITWDFDTSSSLMGASWRIGTLGTGSGDGNYFVIQSTTSTTGTTETFTNAVRIGMNTYNVLLGSTTASTSKTTGALVVSGGLGVAGSIYANAVYGAVWNDYAEYRTTVNNIKAGMVVIEQGDGLLQPSTDRLQPGGNIVSDTFGFAIGETDESKTPLAVSGRALAYPAEDRYSYEPGDAVGTGPNGTVSKMTREEIMMYPERIIGTVSEIPEYERWGTGDVLVDGRIWIKVK